MIDTLLVLNAGSSSLKFQVFGYAELDVLISGKVTGIGDGAALKAKLADGQSVNAELAADDHEAALSAVVELIDSHDDDWRIVAVAHRVVHGGRDFVEPVIVTPAVMAALEVLIPLAPLHQPHNLAGLAASARLGRRAPDIACFDTAFHARHEELFHTFAIDKDLRDKGMRRYGFHGLSYEWIAHVLAGQHPALGGGRVVVAHLGNGASLCALKGGVSIDTTMGMTALDGLPMGTRSGAIDPGAVIFMIRDLGLDADAIEHILYERSGLKGLSGLSNDVQTLLASNEPRARFALDHFALKTAQFIAKMAVSMGGIDGIVFSGGIGEHAVPVRQAILERLGFLGAFETLVIEANEERMMAMHARTLLERQADVASSPTP